MQYGQRSRSGIGPAMHHVAVCSQVAPSGGDFHAPLSLPATGALGFVAVNAGAVSGQVGVVIAVAEDGDVGALGHIRSDRLGVEPVGVALRST